MYPNATQKKTLKQWIGTTRYLYNKVLNKVNKKEEAINWYDWKKKYVSEKNQVPFDLSEDDCSVEDCKNKCVAETTLCPEHSKKKTKRVVNPEIKDWELNTPKDIRADALKDLALAFKTNFKKLREKKINYFVIKYRSKKKEASISIPKTAITLMKNKIKIYGTYITPIKLAHDRCLPRLEIEHGCRLQIENNRWFLCVPVTIKATEEIPKRNWCSLDPGERKIHTIYSEEVTTKIELRKKNMLKLKMKINVLNYLKSTKQIPRHHYKRGIKRINRRIQDLVDDVHYKIITYITKNYRSIFLPKFESQKLVQKMHGKQSKSNLLSLKHYRFRTRLEDKCKLQRYSQVYICTEEYTSKTCGSCGNIYDVGISEIYKCPKCNMVADRDINGARNIGIKYLSENSNTM